MKIEFKNNTAFKSLRTDRMFVRQLSTETGYSLAENNQRNITKAIKNLSKTGTSSTLKFLMETAKNLRFSTNIPYNWAAKNKWKALLMLAVSACAAKAGMTNSKELNNEFKDIFYNRELNEDEQAIIKTHDSILTRLQEFKPDSKEYECAKNNLEYFIISSETSLGDKKYILEKLDYFLSDEYQINPSLADKKFQAFSEIINDLSLDSINEEIPNIKASNQHTHGMCTAFSITRKLLAYEYKRYYTDFILQELDNSDTMYVFDRRELGTGKKTAVKKADIDYEGMLKRGFRIVDAADANWMNIADIKLATADITVSYIPYDENSYGTYNDKHIKNLSNEEFAPLHDYFTALSAAEDKLKQVKLSIIKQKLQKEQNSVDNQLKKVNYQKDLQEHLRTIIISFLGDEYKEMGHDIISGLMSLKKVNSKQLSNDEYIAHEFLYIDNEEDNIKQLKIKSYLNNRCGFALNRDLTDMDIEKIFELTEELHDLEAPAKHSQFNMAKNIIEAVSAFKNQFIKGINIPAKLHSHIIELNLPDEDTVMLENIKELKKKAENNDMTVIEGISANLNTEPSKKTVIEFLNEAEAYITSLPEIYDDIYKSLNLGSRTSVLERELLAAEKILQSEDNSLIDNLCHRVGIYNLKELQSKIHSALEMITHKQLIEDLAQVLECEPDKSTVYTNIKSALEKLSTNDNDDFARSITDKTGLDIYTAMQELINAGTILSGEYDNLYYKKACNLINQKEIKSDLPKYFNAITANISNSVDEEFLKELLINNNLPPRITVETINTALAQIASKINNMSFQVQNIASTLFIEKNGEIYNSVYYPLLVLNHYEKSGLLPKDTTLTSFNNKFEEYYKLNAEKSKYTDKEYKRKRKELTTFTKEEKLELNRMLSKINQMYKMIKREKNAAFEGMEKDLEEIYRNYGVNSGRYWVGTVPSSGLSVNLEIVLLEAATGKPYFIQNNLKKAFDSIKNGAFSGISNSSVSDSNLGLHAQYIADIATVKVPTKNGVVEKDVLFHDNSWGKSEQENTWVDSKGLTRTDYNNDFGYKYGYITNDKYRNGSFTDDLLYKAGKMTIPAYTNKQLKKLSPSETFGFELMDSAILPGRSPKALSIAKSIKDILFIDEDDNIKALEGYARSMGYESLKHKLETMSNIKLTYYTKYNKLIQRIKGDRFSESIASEDAYKNLPDNDFLKIILEKAALRKSFPNSAYTSKINDISTINELNELRNNMLDEATSNFGYTFNKDIKALKYVFSAKNRTLLIKEIITPILDKENISYKSNKLNKILNPDLLLKEIDSYNYDGSFHSFAKTISDLAVDKIIKEYDESITTDISKELKENIYNFIINLYKLQPKDIKEGVLPQTIINWIDKTYQPETDEEFLSIFNKIRNYTFAEYNRHILSKLTDKDVIPEKVTGYDIIKNILACRDDAEYALLNEVFLDEYYKTYDTSILEPYVRYDRFENKVTGATYKKKKFDDIYRGLKSELESINYDKLFNKTKQMAYKKYNLLPGYPKIDTISGGLDAIEESLNILETAFNRYSALKTQLKVFNISEQLSSFVYKHAKMRLSENEDKQLRKQILNIVNYTKDEPAYNDVREELEELLKNTELIVPAKILPVVKKVDTLNSTLLKLCSKEEYQNNIDMAYLDLERSIEVYLRLKILPNMRDRVRAKINEWFKERLNNTPNIKEKYNELVDLSINSYILDNPGKLLDEYLLLKAGKQTVETKYFEIPLRKSLEMLLHSSRQIELQEIIMDATRNGVTNAVSKEFDNVDVELIKYENGAYISELVPMSSPEALTYMVKSLIMENNNSAAIDFIQKFNIEEKVIPLLIELPEVKIAEEIIKNLEKDINGICREIQIVNQLYKWLKSLPSETSATQITSICQRIIDKLNKECPKKDSYYIADLISAFSNVIESDRIRDLQGITVSVFLSNILEAAVGDSSKQIITELTSINEELKNAQIIREFIDELQLPENEELISKVEEFRWWYDNIIGKQNALMKRINEQEILE